MNKPNFWDDKKTSEAVISEMNNLKNILNKVETLKKQIKDNREMLELLKMDNDEEIKEMVMSEISVIKDNFSLLEMELLLNGPHDKGSCILEVHSGAGGTEACDWALMLQRMYTRWCEKNKYKIELIDSQDGDGAGIKSASMIIRGINAFGYLKNEKGVHRLIRISPFDSGARRHTSFASVDVTPLFENKEVNIEIEEKDLRIDVYRSSGAGGQGVNTTDSAVRVTHLPTKLVVTCQNERSQIQNKEKAIEVLKNKLYKMEIEKQNEELSKIKGENSAINFGSQIRTYTMHPYSLVKDHRTLTETANVNKVMDGEIDIFISALLKQSEI